MTRQRKPSRQTLAVLQALLVRPTEWHYGYALTKQVGLQSGTLYPVLMRLTDEGMLEAEWHPPARLGLPARHAYRLSWSGVQFARASLAAAQDAATPVGGGLAPA